MKKKTIQKSTRYQTLTKKFDLSQSTNGGIALRLNLVGAPQEMDAATPNPSTLKNQLLRVADDT
jgi:hypothetical protein